MTVRSLLSYQRTALRATSSPCPASAAGLGPVAALADREVRTLGIFAGNRLSMTGIVCHNFRMNKKKALDFWYAVNNTEIVVMPERHLETFGTTVLNYHLVSELMDSVGQTRIREGRMQAGQPQIVTPESYSKTLLEGFGEEASRYVEWLKANESSLRILQYGYQLKQESFNEHIVTESRENVVKDIKERLEKKADPLTALVVGVDEPWDVCLIKLFWEVVQNSAQTNVQQLAQRNLFDTSTGLSVAVRQEIENAFLAASRDASRVRDLGDLLRRHGVFEDYEDRFFALVRPRG